MSYLCKQSEIASLQQSGIGKTSGFYHYLKPEMTTAILLRRPPKQELHLLSVVISETV